ncbi:unnamed protein product [Bursaphelenchus okinawaensis]|uniref:Uncharacterized protein n=1 Tax=Bursaphelenchus okinawaensis TaxID=465554 RepID=A0A811L9D5_9BILA|nr:unnamed protein product [Bursaphelenchus okinawaensis]CAG9118629.1 unnamed protein product [Bursaphelenchus okinawaensis]
MTTTYTYYNENALLNYWEPHTSTYNYADVNLNAFYYQSQQKDKKATEDKMASKVLKTVEDIQMAQIQRNEELVQMLSPIRKCQERIQAGQTKRNAENARRKFSLTNGVKKNKNAPAHDPKRSSLSMRRWKTEIVSKLQVQPHYYTYDTSRWSASR